MAIPRSVTETIAGLRQERGPLAARLDAIDLAIDNLSRVYGVHGSQPPLPIERRTPKAQKAARPRRAVVVNTDTNAPAGRSMDAIARRELILTLIAKAEHGLTGREITNATAKMDDVGRRNALTVLRTTGKIKRNGNVWQAVTRAA